MAATTSRDAAASSDCSKTAAALGESLCCGICYELLLDPVVGKSLPSWETSCWRVQAIRKHDALGQLLLLAQPAVSDLRLERFGGKML
jgi:hypothetical protein